MKKALALLVSFASVVLMLAACGDAAVINDTGVTQTEPTYVITDDDVPNTPPISPTRISEIERAWEDGEGNPLSFDAECVYYTSIGGYDVFILPGFIYKATEKKIGQSTFEYDRSFTIYAYKDGAIRTLEDAYKSGVISQREVAVIAYIHNKLKG